MYVNSLSQDTDINTQDNQVESMIHAMCAIILHVFQTIICHKCIGPTFIIIIHTRCFRGYEGGTSKLCLTLSAR